jgi:nucleoside-diphosphate-sugar epimerase
MPERYITGSHGFIGSRLKVLLPDSVSIPHADIPTAHIDNFNYFYFLSSYGNMADQKDTSKIIQANLTDPVDVVQRTIGIKYRSFVYFSSSSVNLPVQTVYSRCKRASEEVLQAVSEAHGKPICIIRPYSVTGVGEQPKHLIPTVIRSCIDGEPMNLTPDPVHDFIDVEDVVNGTINLSLNGARGIYELGTGEQYSNRQVLEMVEDITKRKARVSFVTSMRKYDTRDWVCNDFKARNWGWSPQKTLEQSVREMVNDYQKNESN